MPIKPSLESWSLKLDSPASRRSLWLCFSALRSANGFKNVREVKAILYSRDEGRGAQKVALAHSVPASECEKTADGVRSKQWEFSPTKTSGSIATRTGHLSWDLRIETPGAAFAPFSEPLRTLGLITGVPNTLFESARVSGTCTLDDTTIELGDATASLRRLSTSRLPHTWSWAHCNTIPGVVFEAWTVQSPLALSAVYLDYLGEKLIWNSTLDSLRVRSHRGLLDWKLRAERGPLTVACKLKGEHRDFAGFALEDPTGSLLYAARSQLSDLTLTIYRGGKLEKTFNASGSASFETASLQKNPYVPLLL